MQTPIANQPLFWHQGLFLQPQHLQQQEFYLRNMLQPLQRYLVSNFWGVAALTPDIAGLQNCRLGLHEGAFLWPDGSWVTLPGNATLHARQLPQELPAGKTQLLVYLGMKRWNHNQANCHFTDDEETIQQSPRRFRCPTQPLELIDLHQSESTGQVRKMDYDLKLFWETEQDRMEDFDLLPILRLVREQEQWQIDSNYLPPLLDINCLPTMSRIWQEIRDVLVARCHQLNEYKNPSALKRARPEQQTGMINYLLALRTLNRYLPLWCSLEQTGCHPAQAYQYLQQLIGELSTFSLRVDALGHTTTGQALIPQYDHKTISDCFLQVRKLLIELLDEIIIGPEHILPMLRDDQGFAVEIPVQALDRRNRYYILIKNLPETEGAQTTLLQLSKIAAEEEMGELCQRALPGLKTKITSAPPGLPQREDTLYLELDSTDTHWNAIQNYRNLRLQWDQAPDCQCELVVIQD